MATMEKLREALAEVGGECGLPAALEAMGERWSFLILRGAFNGLHHFEEYQSELGGSLCKAIGTYLQQCTCNSVGCESIPSLLSCLLQPNSTFPTNCFNSDAQLR